MILAVLANSLQREEMAVSPFFSSHEVIFSENSSLWAHHNADAFMDLEFESTPERIKFLARLLPKPVLVNAVTDSLDRIHPDFIRINGWPGFLKGKCLEAAARPAMQEKARQQFGENMLFVPDQPGLVSARILAMIINEAHYTSEAGTATREEIDLAMRLGTGYPLGPFAWADLIGIKRVAELLDRLLEKDPIYQRAESLK